jgi:DNA-binding transcriptional LysR family regulator
MDISHRLSFLRIRQLRLLACLGQGLTLSASAEHLMISAPGASLMLQEIESLFGVQLFERDRRGVRPTGPGKLVVSHVSLLLQDFANLESDVDEIKRSRSTLLLGAIPQALIQLVPQMAMRYKEKNLGLLKVTEGTSDALMSRLMDGDLNAAILRLGENVRMSAQAMGLHFDVLSQDEIALVIPKSHALARLRHFSHAELAELDWVLPPTGSHIRACLERYFVSNRLGVPRTALVVDSAVQSLLCAASAGCAAAGPLSVINRLSSAFGLKQLPFRIADQPVNVSLVYRAAQNEMPTFRALREIALEVANSSRPASVR